MSINETAGIDQAEASPPDLTPKQETSEFLNRLFPTYKGDSKISKLLSQTNLWKRPQ